MSITDDWAFSPISGELYLFEEYLATLENFLETEARKHKESLSNLVASGQLQYYEGEGLESNYDSDRLEMLRHFTNILRSSFFTNLYSYLETRILEECRSRKTEDILLNLSDLRGQDGIEKAKNYFTKVLRADFPSNTPQWDEIQNYALLRNCLVDAQGKPEGLKDDNQRKKLSQYVARKGNLSLIWEEVYIDKGFCEEALNIVEAFLHAWLYSDEAK